MEFNNRIRRDVIEAIGVLSSAWSIRQLLTEVESDDPYSIEQLRDPRMNLSVIRPLVDKFYEMNDASISK
jgi:hypothetical protein